MQQKVNTDVRADQIRTQNLSVRFELLKLAVDTHKTGRIGEEVTHDQIIKTAKAYWDFVKENKGVEKLLTE